LSNWTVCIDTLISRSCRWGWRRRRRSGVSRVSSFCELHYLRTASRKCRNRKYSSNFY